MGLSTVNRRSCRGGLSVAVFNPRLGLVVSIPDALGVGRFPGWGVEKTLRESPLEVVAFLASGRWTPGSLTGRCRSAVEF